MEYKVGDEVLVRARIIEVKEDEKTTYKVKRCGNPVPDNFASTIYVKKTDIVPEQDMTAEEAWEIAKKILLHPANGGFNSTELEEIFGRTEHLWELSPQQAKAKIQAWEAEKEIKVGDEVEITYNGNKFFVSQIDNDDQNFPYNGFDENLKIYHDWARNQLKKTGRHIDIDGILKQIGDTDA